jgi:hypothetical protein
MVDGDGEGRAVGVGVLLTMSGRFSASARDPGMGAQRMPVVWRTTNAT